MIWFEQGRIPEGQWPLLNPVYGCLREIEETLGDPVDLTEGTGDILITGCVTAYRQAVMRRVLNLALATVTLWNAGLPLGALVCGRSLLETIAIFHAFLTRAQAASAAGDWEGIGRLVDTYAFSTSAGPGKNPRPEDLPRIGRAVRDFIRATQPEAEKFWDQICDAAHPNGNRMLLNGGTLRDGMYYPRADAENEQVLFTAVYNSLASCNWLFCADAEDLPILLEEIRQGGPLPSDHRLVLAREATSRAVERVQAAASPEWPA